MKDMVSNARTSGEKPSWIAPLLWDRMLAHWDTQEEKQRSRSYSNVRKSDRNGLGPHIHFLGPKSFQQIQDEMVSHFVHSFLIVFTLQPHFILTSLIVWLHYKKRKWVILFVLVMFSSRHTQRLMVLLLIKRRRWLQRNTRRMCYWSCLSLRQNLLLFQMAHQEHGSSHPKNIQPSSLRLCFISPNTSAGLNLFLF